MMGTYLEPGMRHQTFQHHPRLCRLQPFRWVLRKPGFTLSRTCLIWSTVLLLSASTAWPAVFFVTDTNDSVRISSLRGAVIAANQLKGNSTIILGQRPLPWQRERVTYQLSNPRAEEYIARTGDLGVLSGSLPNASQPESSVYRLTIPGARENQALTGDLDITSGNLLIIGVGPNVIIDASGLGDRVFQVLPKARLALCNLTIRGGTAPPAEWGSFYTYTPGAEKGGAIHNAGGLTLHRCAIQNNASGDGGASAGNGSGRYPADGGGVYNSGLLSAYHSLFSHNSAGTGVAGSPGGNGGGLRNDGTCVLDHCIFEQNQAGDGTSYFEGARGGHGGGVFNSGKMLAMNCLLRGNSSGRGADGSGWYGSQHGIAMGGPGGPGGNGGGIYNLGQLRLHASSLFGNRTDSGGDGLSAGTGGNGGAGGCGAGIFNGGNLLIRNSTISSNSCSHGGEGGSARWPFYGFTALGGTGGTGGSGAGIYNTNLLALLSCTIVLNQTGQGGNSGNGVYTGSVTQQFANSGGNSGRGGGVLNVGPATTAEVGNTLIAQNLGNVAGTGGTNTVFVAWSTMVEVVEPPGANGYGPDVAGSFISRGFNLLGQADETTGFAHGVKSDQVGTSDVPIDPLLGPLQMNGGPTPTHALLPGSPAIDQGMDFDIHNDQRGYKRPSNIRTIPNPAGGDGADIGALELHLP